MATSKGIPKIALQQPKGMTVPKAETPKLPLIDKRQSVGRSNVTKTRWSPPASVKKMGNH